MNEQRRDVPIHSECVVLEMGLYKIFWLLKWQLLCLVLSWNLVSGQIRYSIPEELQLGAFVGNIAADVGLDVEQLSARNFRIVPSPRKQYLYVKLDKGVLLVNQKIDREQICGSAPDCALTLETVIDDPLNVYHIEVEILDINDNAPQFPKNEFHLEISELAAPGSRFPLESAYDPDVGTNSLQTYRLATNQYFVLDVQSRSGDSKLPVLVMERTPDREHQSTLQLLLTALDGGIPERSGTAQIIIRILDANDNVPTFSQALYRVRLLENVPLGTLVIKVNATDLDEGSNGEIVYSFGSHASAKARELFSVDPNTGEIRVTGPLDFETGTELEISVQAKDRGFLSVPVHCDILVEIVDVNDNAPEVAVTSLSSSVAEDVPPGTVVALISVTDSDTGGNGETHCQIPNSLPFKLDSTFENYYRLLTKDLLDRELISQYGITISCSDAGLPALTTNKTIQLKISDVNDNPPHFSQTLYTAYVMENNIIGSSIYSVLASDADVNQNSKLSYSILKTQAGGSPVFGYVSINSDNGIISAERSFDYEELKNFQIEVQATDAGELPLSTNVSINVVILDQNDNAPVIVSPRPEYGSTAAETLSRSAEPGYLVAKVSAVDADSGQNARLTYQLAQVTNPGLFTIAPDTGEIWTIRRVVNEDATEQRLVVVVKDNGIPPLKATINIILTLEGSDTKLLSELSGLSEELGFSSDISLYLVIALGTTSSIFLVVLVILAVQVHRSRNVFNRRSCSLGTCGCMSSTHSLNGIQKASVNLQIPPNYVEVFGRDPLSQNCCYEVKQPNTDWRLSQTHRAELNSSQYLEEEGVQREIQCEVQREVQRDVQREVPRDVQCDVPRNVQRDLQRDVHCDVQHVAENDPGGPRKPMCARPPAIPEIIEASPIRAAGDQSWTPRLAVKFPAHHQASDYLHNVYIPGTTTTLSGKSTTEREGKKSFITFGKKKKTGK
ncbi:protocadherin gamma-A11-like isoform X19 [Pristis pectinata]|uniref:protocadherin gamma-A11-like isoform X19 n=1 Tax=Pristis pectinata TaxID=685728 RepID=UPI00223D6C66|nr:protocadherin gamma-A11-like isoform X19 [Pristis pectinata]